jgi:hypothetical protein
MDSLTRRARPTRWILAGLLVCGAFPAREPARAQTAASGQGRAPARDAGAVDRAKPDAGGRGRDPGRGQDQTPAAAQTQQPRRQPSAAYRDSLRKTLEKRRERRARRAQGQGFDGARPIGAIVPWPLPPALIIRHTPEVHGEVDSLLGRLRR